MHQENVKSVVEEWDQILTRTLIIVGGLLYFIWHVIMTVNLPFNQARYIFLVSIIYLFIFITAFLLLSRFLNLSKFVWLLGLIITVTLTSYFQEQPLILYLLGIIPLLAAILLRSVYWVFLLIIVMVITGYYQFLPFHPDFSLQAVIVVNLIGFLSGLFTWIMSRFYKERIGWAVIQLLEREDRLREARQRQLEMSQMQEDLSRANREMMQLYSRLKAMEQVAEEARRVKEEFVANVSHELRTPLNMIIGFCEMIKYSPQVYGQELPTILQSDIDTILRNSLHLSQLVDDVLDLSQVDSGRMAVTKDWTALPEIIEDTVIAVAPLYESKKLFLRASIPHNLPQLFVDSTRIRQVIINLLSNAGRFTEKGGVDIIVSTTDSDVVIVISDTGPGISKKDQERIFEPFQQADNSIRRLYGGSGLGLAISKRFVEMHGGKISVDSEVNKGTKVIFTIPKGVITSDSINQITWKRSFNTIDNLDYKLRNRKNLAPPPDLLPRYVLLERGLTLKRLMDRYLTDIETVSVLGIDEALLELARAPANALLVNASPFTKPGGTIDALKNLPFNTPAILFWLPDNNITAERYGGSQYLIKPVSRDMLLSSIESIGKDVKSVIIVDDQIEILQLFSRMLNSTEKKFKVWLARNGADALDKMRKWHPDVAILDLMMPIMDGYQVIDNMHADKKLKDIPIIIVSSRDPNHEIWISNTMTIMRSGSFSVDEFLNSIRFFSEIFSLPKKSSPTFSKTLGG